LAHAVRPLRPKGRFAPILLKKAFGGGERNFLRPLMRFMPRYLGDHDASPKNDHKPPYRRYGASKQLSCPKLSIGEIFGVAQLSTFSTVSARNGRSKTDTSSDRKLVACWHFWAMPIEDLRNPLYQ
jgi:hypothetical protein